MGVHGKKTKHTASETCLSRSEYFGQKCTFFFSSFFFPEYFTTCCTDYCFHFHSLSHEILLVLGHASIYQRRPIRHLCESQCSIPSRLRPNQTAVEMGARLLLHTEKERPSRLMLTTLPVERSRAIRTLTL